MKKPTPKEARDQLRESVGISDDIFMQLAMSRIMYNTKAKNASNFERDYLRDLNKVFLDNPIVRSGDAWIVASILINKIATCIMTEAVEASKAVSSAVEMSQNERYKLTDNLAVYIRNSVMEDLKKSIDKVFQEKIVPHIYEGKDLKS